MTAIHLVRARDPLTSYAAAVRSRTFATGHCDRILAAIGVCQQIRPDAGATAAEIAGEAGLSIEQTCRRLPELLKSGRVKVLVHDDGADLVRGGFRCWGLV